VLTRSTSSTRPGPRPRPFGGEVEPHVAQWPNGRPLCCSNAAKDRMPQTRFVLRKCLSLGHPVPSWSINRSTGPMRAPRTFTRRSSKSPFLPDLDASDAPARLFRCSNAVGPRRGGQASISTILGSTARALSRPYRQESPPALGRPWRPLQRSSLNRVHDYGGPLPSPASLGATGPPPTTRPIGNSQEPGVASRAR